MRHKIARLAAACLVLVLLAVSTPVPVMAQSAAAGDVSIPCEFRAKSIHVDLVDPTVRQAVLNDPLVIASAVRRQYLAAGYNQFYVPLWQFAFEVAGHALAAGASEGIEGDAAGGIFNRAVVADCAVDTLDSDAEYAILGAQVYYARQMSRICFGL